MWPRKILQWGPPLMVVAVFGLWIVALVHDLGLTKRLSHSEGYQPYADFPAQVHVGPVTSGVQTKTRFTVANRGQAPLVITPLQGSCACTHWDRVRHQQRETLARYIIDPGASEEFEVQFVTNATTGSEFHEHLAFRSNDPRFAEGRIALAIGPVLGGYFCVPNAVLLGEIGPGETKSTEVLVYDTSKTARPIKLLECHPPHLLQATWTPVNADADFPSRERMVPAGRLTISVHGSEELVSLREMRVRLLAAELHDRPTELVVRARFMPDLMFSPDLIALPRGTGNSESFDTIVTVRSGRDPLPTKLDVATPPGLTYAWLDAEGPAVRRLQVRLDPAHYERHRGGEMALVVRSGDGKSKARLRVLLRD